jgi:hypothetical protein
MITQARREKLIVHDFLHLTDCNYRNQSDMIVGNTCDLSNAIFAKQEKRLKMKVRPERHGDLMGFFGFKGRGMI